MSKIITVIADKDVGPVLGAVSEAGSDAKLPVSQVVSENGFPVRTNGLVKLEVPVNQLETYEATGNSALLEPTLFAVVDKVPVVTAGTIKTGTGGSTFKSTEIDLALNPAPAAGTELMVKVIARHDSDGETMVYPATKIVFDSSGVGKFGVNLRAGETYQFILLVEKYQASALETTPT